MSLPTVDDLKAHLNKNDNVDDAELGDVLDAAVDIAEGIVGSLTSDTVTETHYGITSDVLVLRRAPVLGLASVSGRLYPGAQVASYSLTDYTLDQDTGVLRVGSGLRFAGDYTVTYTVGRALIPLAIRLGILVVAAQLWETQRVAGTRSAFNGPGSPTPMGFAIPNRAVELFAPFRLLRMA